MNTILSKRNILLVVLSIATILIGYVCLASGTADGPLSLKIAPVLLVIGYCVLVPIAFLLKAKKGPEESNKKKQS